MNNAPDFVPCAACGELCDTGTALYSSRDSLYFCDANCFDEWADEHFGEVAGFYRLMNVE